MISMSDAALHVTVEEIMTEPVETVERDSPVSAAARTLCDDRIGSLLVESDDDGRLELLPELPPARGRLVGAVTAR
ncbi:CBS domain-containing protein [Salinigranum salinum]|uniref:CBS domain-containing protein n=1 Tax=Salinigranum salinum TaxID=1364937 RepID=UPI001260E0AB|nr:CBS domain-containing protein [Salinigranum salinum]